MRGCGLMAFFPGLCASSGERLPEALYKFFCRIQKVQKCVLSIIYFHYLIFNFGSFLQKTHKCTSVLFSQKTHKCTSCRSRQELSHDCLIFTCKHRLRYSRERGSQSSPNMSQKLEYAQVFQDTSRYVWICDSKNDKIRYVAMDPESADYGVIKE